MLSSRPISELFTPAAGPAGRGEASVPLYDASPAAASSSSSALVAAASWWPPSWQTVAIVVLLLALVGINVFVLLARGTQDLADLVAPLLKLAGYTAVSTTQQVVGTSAVGVDAVSDAAVAAADAIPGGRQSRGLGPGDELRQALRDAAASDGSGGAGVPRPDDAASPIQSGKSGWCYIGEERGVRSCAPVGVNDTCMSGDVFPTRAVCVNPSLRP